MAVQADVAEEAQVRRMFAEVDEHFGRLDALVNSAGISLAESRVADFEQAALERLMAVNVIGTMLCCREAARRMSTAEGGGGGAIVNVSSMAATIGGRLGRSAYAASKNGLNALTKSVTCEWAKHNIQCNAICPTVILTPMGEKVWGQPEKGDPMKAKIPAGRFGRPVEVADLVLYLASPASDLVNGDTIMLDGGYTAL